MVIWYSLGSFGIFFPFWYILQRKIWQHGNASTIFFVPWAVSSAHFSGLGVGSGFLPKVQKNKEH
jgi:ABC-type sugar transport system permease subunit